MKIVAEGEKKKAKFWAVRGRSGGEGGPGRGPVSGSSEWGRGGLGRLRGVGAVRVVR